MEYKQTKSFYLSLVLLICFFTYNPINAQKLIPVGEGWANNSVNVALFRKNSLITHDNTQYIAYYNPEGFVTIGKRMIGSDDWEKHQTQYKGNVTDAHNIISLMVDGNGFLHISWDHHGNALNYAKGVAPYSLILGEKQQMTGYNESNVTYPEFFRMPNGNLIFMYRDGQSGKGNLVMNYYDLKNESWRQIQQNLIDGENARNAYWQSYVDQKGIIHISWVWRETWDVSTNHDMCYTKSYDGGITWVNSNNEPYSFPINASSAEYVWRIPQNSELINQTSMTADAQGNPYIATYWREPNSEIPQYHIIYSNGEKWSCLNLDFRKSAFSLTGGGTKSIPIARPQILAGLVDGKLNLYFLFRDEERDSKVSMARCINQKDWAVSDLTSFSVGAWEPTFDTELWKHNKRLNIFVQKVTQIDEEGRADVQPEMIQVLELPDDL